MKSEPQVWPATILRHRHFHIDLAILLLFAAGWATAGTIAQKPLFLGSTAPPSVILAVDDSSSMKNEVLMISGADSYTVGSKKFDFLFPDGYYSGSGGSTTNLPPTIEYADARSPETNLAYFDPKTTYTHWPTYGNAIFPNASPEAAPWDPTMPNPAASAPFTCPNSAKPSPTFPKTYDLTRAIQCSGKGYSFSMTTGMTIPSGTVFLPTAAPPGWCATKNDANWYTAKKDCVCNSTDFKCAEIAIRLVPDAV